MQPGLPCSSLFGGGDVGEGDKEASIQPAPPGTRHQLLRLAVVCRADRMGAGEPLLDRWRAGNNVTYPKHASSWMAA